MNDVEEVKHRLDIVEVISGYVELKKAGKDYRGISPFRQERTPSFFVSPDKQIWHDFGSNEGGDVISFVMRQEGLSFPEALEMLAARAGVKLTRRGGEKGESKSRLYELVELAVKYYHYQLSQSAVALDYIRNKRGLETETIKAFMVGYAPDTWSGLTDFALKKGFQQAELVTAGLAARRNRGDGVYDVFRGRVMFPVYDAQGRAVGFSGRLMSDEARAAKYINTPDTPLYHKSRAMFGLKQAKEAIRQADTAVLVEGNVDVISLWQHGQKNVVAVSGTALTADQLKILGRLAQKIILCFDQDSAGLKATQRAIELAQGTDTRLEVMSFTGAKDPDELIRSDPKAWRQAVQSAQYALDYLFEYAEKTFGTQTAPQKKAFTRFLIPTLRDVTDRIELEHYVTRLSQSVGVDVPIIRNMLMTSGVSATPKTVSTISVQSSPQQVEKPLSRQEKLEQVVLEISLSHAHTRMALEDLKLDELSARHRPIFTMLKKHPTATLDKLTKLLPDRSEDVKMLALRGDHEYSAMTEHERGLEAFTQVHTLQKHITAQKKRALSREIAAFEAAGEVGKAAATLKAYQALTDSTKDL